ncbi:MAG TPA: hypothetical protein VFA74_20225 [Terriglobales bacterium]|nr:hypothetical protein [Terriglobales bacterium]
MSIAFCSLGKRPAVTEVVAWAAGNGDRSENADYQYGKRRLRQIDGWIQLQSRSTTSVMSSCCGAPAAKESAA